MIERKTENQRVERDSEGNNEGGREADIGASCPREREREVLDGGQRDG